MEGKGTVKEEEGKQRKEANGKGLRMGAAKGGGSQGKEAG